MKKEHPNAATLRIMKKSADVVTADEVRLLRLSGLSGSVFGNL
jgi:hypothetical protein